MLFGSKLRTVHEENLNGYDYIIGDLHGSIHLLEKFMLLMFDKKVDRMFSVGDLIDRGIRSYKSLQLIREPWFFPVLGNHEGMFYSFIDPFGDGDWRQGNSFWGNGGNWVNDYDVADKKEDLKDLAELLTTLPRIRTIEGKNKVHIIHAEFPIGPNKKYKVLTDAMIEDDEICMELCTTQSWDGDYSCWGRDQFADFNNNDPTKVIFYDEDVKCFESPDLSLVVCGHTIVKRPVLFGKLLNVDTGAWFSPRPLTIYDVKRQKLWQVNPDSDDVMEVEPFVVKSSKPD
ncbi:MAG TPA: metallophosphoesterase [Methanosarcina sp.]|nr:metallophosphoesterase [Methanosarcina sp.]